MSISSTYKSKFSFDTRKNESSRIRAKYIDHIPVIVDKGDNIKENINKQKFLVPYNFTVGQFIYVIRRRINLPPEKAIFVFINHVIPNVSDSIGQIYDKYKDEDGFLYVVYTSENTFG